MGDAVVRRDHRRLLTNVGSTGTLRPRTPCRRHARRPRMRRGAAAGRPGHGPVDRSRRPRIRQQRDNADAGHRRTGLRAALPAIPDAAPLQPRGDADPRRRLWDVFRQDRRRYDPDVDEGRRYRRLTCGRPMIRREGLCDRNASSQRRLTDPATGRRQWVGCCSQSACKRWFTDLLERNRRELAANPPPTPAANTGGVLERHLPEVDWWVVWKQVDPGWCPPPEGRPFGKPTLTVIVGGDEPEMSVPRPALTVIEGGRR